MSVLLLRLAGPMQAWGDSSRYARRETRLQPTKSGVLGLIAAAQGRQRTESLDDLAALRFGVRIDQPGHLTRDFQTAIRWADPAQPSMPLSYRYYLADAVFLAGIEGERSVMDALHAALRTPAYPLYLGRRSCPVEGELALGVVDSGLVEALTEHPWLASMRYRRSQGQAVHLPILVDAADTQDSHETARDVPVSFSPERREYSWRHVAAAPEKRVINPDGHHRPDFFAALGGV
ncbi:MAG: type I-E CRISPR-associated protein Cas5/CasD [Actinomycetales bacterium]|nr:type I-E CRISPR-associated protein Cas5/CasD [Candidatus Lutibacillus vidarii]